jgi:hypothetical protein
MRKIQRILVAVKAPGAQWSPAVAKATQIARATGAHLELFHGVDTRLYVDALDTYENGIRGFEALQSDRSGATSSSARRAMIKMRTGRHRTRWIPW